MRNIILTCTLLLAACGTEEALAELPAGYVGTFKFAKKDNSGLTWGSEKNVGRSWWSVAPDSYGYQVDILIIDAQDGANRRRVGKGGLGGICARKIDLQAVIQLPDWAVLGGFVMKGGPCSLETPPQADLSFMRFASFPVESSVPDWKHHIMQWPDFPESPRPNEYVVVWDKRKEEDTDGKYKMVRVVKDGTAKGYFEKLVPSGMSDKYDTVFHSLIRVEQLETLPPWVGNILDEKPEPGVPRMVFYPGGKMMDGLEENITVENWSAFPEVPRLGDYVRLQIDIDRNIQKTFRVKQVLRGYFKWLKPKNVNGGNSVVYRYLVEGIQGCALPHWLRKSSESAPDC